MKNEQENGAHESSAQEQMQEQLCGYLLQELDAQEMAHVEQRLAESAVWREERDRLSGTIGLVRSAMEVEAASAPEGEQLSESALQHLAMVGTQAAAGHGKGSASGAVQASPMRMFVPVAATIAVALGGFLAYQKTIMPPDLHNEATAKADGTLSDAGRPYEPGFGVKGGESGALEIAESALESAPAPGEKRPIFNIKHTGEIVVRKDPLYNPETRDGSKDPMVDVKEKLAVIAEGMSRTKDAPDDHLMVRGDTSVPFNRVKMVTQGASPEGVTAAKVQLAAKGSNPEAELGVRSFSTGGMAPENKRGETGWAADPVIVEDLELGEHTETTGEIFHLTQPAGAPARNERKRLASKETPKSKAPASSHGGHYRGPGDTAPPAGVGPVASTEPASPGTSGPSSPGPGGPSPALKPGQPVARAAVPELGAQLGQIDRLREERTSAPVTQDARNELTDAKVAEALKASENTARLAKVTKKSLDGMGYAGGDPKKVRGRLGFELRDGEEPKDGAQSGYFLDADMDEDARARAQQLYDFYAVDELQSEIGPDAETLLAMADESADEFRARMEELHRIQLGRKAETSKEGEADRPESTVTPQPDRFKDDNVVRETPEQLELRLRASIAERAAKRHQHLISSCIPKPNERPNAMYYRWWGDNPFVYTSTDRQATFAADVDTASYTLARRYLTGGNLPTREQVRTEEFVNYFAGDIPAPTEDVFAVQTEMTASPFGGSQNRYMLRVGIRGKVVPKDQRPPMALVFVVDTSGSMDNGNRMDLVKHSLRLLGTELDGRDQVGLVSFASEARLVLPMTSMDERSELESAVQSLSPDGSTNVEDGLRLGYELLSRVPSDGRLRRVVLISDGVANTGSTVADEILKSVKMHRESGIYLSTVGVGMGNHNDALLERLANRGDGICDYVDDADAARRAMVERFSGGFIPIARDLKIQLEFESQSVLRYRQIGYENRAVADADFRNDAVDGGEVGSGHQVTALFELECVDMPQGAEISMHDLGKVRLRYKSVQTGSDAQVFETEHGMKVKAGPAPFDAASPGLARAVVAAQFAEVLRRSTHAAGDDYGKLLAHAVRVSDLPAFAGDGETQELAGMIRRAGKLGAGAQVRRDELWTTVDTYRKHRYLCGTEQEMGGRPTSERLAEIAAINAELEDRIRALSLREALQGR
ncbi:MAG: von Willebrand factor type A domain-containing protein [Planctomycetota bacterium]|nr:von Willebrand factor type A domain-containing protein [Planctomycetota bacterium]